jgi:hypothetical protein
MHRGRDEPITFAEWGYVGRGKYQRRDFRLDALALSSTFGEDGHIFAKDARHEVFTPVRTWGLLTIAGLAFLWDEFDDPRPVK